MRKPANWRLLDEQRCSLYVPKMSWRAHHGPDQASKTLRLAEDIPRLAFYFLKNPPFFEGVSMVGLKVAC